MVLEHSVQHIVPEKIPFLYVGGGAAQTDFETFYSWGKNEGVKVAKNCIQGERGNLGNVHMNRCFFWAGIRNSLIAFKEIDDSQPILPSFRPQRAAWLNF